MTAMDIGYTGRIAQTRIIKTELLLWRILVSCSFNNVQEKRYDWMFDTLEIAAFEASKYVKQFTVYHNRMDGRRSMSSEETKKELKNISSRCRHGLVKKI